MSPTHRQNGRRVSRWISHIASAILTWVLISSPELHAQTPGVEQACGIRFDATHTPFLHWQGKTGLNYFVQMSYPADHLVKWTWVPIIESGHNTLIEHEVDGTADNSFFRLQYTDQPIPPGKTLDTADFDGDGISNLGEITPYTPPGTYTSIQTDPLDPDTDHDGLLDKWEREHGLNPTDNG